MSALPRAFAAAPQRLLLRTASRAGLRRMGRLGAWACLAAWPALAPALSAQALQSLHQACPRWDDCVDAAEAKALRDPEPPARREGRQLQLSLPSGVLRFEDDITAGRRHRYLGLLDGTGWLLVAGLKAGQTHVWLIDPQTSLQLELDGLPWPSPDGRLLAVATPARADQGGLLALHLRAGQRWSRLYFFEAPKGLGFEVKSWRQDSAAVRLGWTRQPAAGAAAGCNGLTQLRDGPYGWDLVPEVPATCP